MTNSEQANEPVIGKSTKEITKGKKQRKFLGDPKITDDAHWTQAIYRGSILKPNASNGVNTTGQRGF